jgi:hypothetical protein
MLFLLVVSVVSGFNAEARSRPFFAKATVDRLWKYEKVEEWKSGRV